MLSSNTLPASCLHYSDLLYLTNVVAVFRRRHGEVTEELRDRDRLNVSCVSRCPDPVTSPRQVAVCRVTN